MPLQLVSKTPIERRSILRSVGTAFNMHTGYWRDTFPWLHHLGRPVAFVAAFVLEAALLWLLLVFLTGAPSLKQVAQDTVQIVALSPNAQPDLEAALQNDNGVRRPAVSKPPSQAVQAPTALPEWSVRKIPMREVADIAGEAAGVTAVKNGSETGQQSSYDPHAGAAMLPLGIDEPPDRVAGVWIDWSSIASEVNWTPANRRALADWLRTLKKRLPRARGSLQIKVSMDENGRVQTAKVMSGNAPIQMKQFISSHAKYLRLGIGMPKSLILPKIELVA